ncbi:TPA: GNAT family N-acetyltransferase [Pseudomonas putida]|nr:GNAT family N-acetyltransferase [Pseudomonas putida]
MQLMDYRDLNQTQRAQLLDIQLHPEQLRYAGDVASAVYLLQSCKSDHRRALVLVLDGVPQALLLLQRGAFLPTWAQAGAATITALQVDKRFQGRGLGRWCMQALPAVVRAMWPDVECLQLSVDRDNHPALGLYRATGWVGSGEGYRARSGYECCMTLML